MNIPETPYFVAIRQNEPITTLEKLERQGQNINFINVLGNNAFMYSVLYGSIEMMYYFLQRGFSINSVNYSGNNGLLLSLFSDSQDKALFLIKQGININHQNTNGDTALHIAVQNEKYFFEVIHSLFENGVNTTIQNLRGQTPIFYIKKRQVLELFHSHKADLNVVDIQMKSPLYYYLETNDDELILYAISFGAQIKGIIQYLKQYANRNPHSKVKKFLKLEMLSIPELEKLFSKDHCLWLRLSYVYNQRVFKQLVSLYQQLIPMEEPLILEMAEITDSMLQQCEFSNCLLGPNKTNNKMTLVLDMDETLLHSYGEERDKAHIRPGVDVFLKEMSKYFEIIVFTAGSKPYAEPFLKEIDPYDNYISYKLYRNHCLLSNGRMIKDLSLLGRDLRRVIIIDNSPYVYQRQPHNAIPIKSWYDDPHDKELFEMMDFLKKLSKVDNVQEILDSTLSWRQVSWLLP